MAKGVIAAAAFLVVLLALSKATDAYKTTITTTVIEDENQQGQTSQRCRQQMQMMQMRQCKNYLMSQMGQGGPFNRVAIKMMVDGDNNQMGLQQCCMELRNVDDECRCEVIKQMVMQQMQEGQMEQGQQQMQKMMQMARNLPAMCNMQPYQCQF